MAKDIGTSNLLVHEDTFPGIYRAKVEDNLDPKKLGRIKARIYPMLADAEVSVLPWAVPMYPIWEGAGGGIGYFAVPDIGTYVFVMFEQGDIYQPVYIGEAPTGTMGLPSERTTNYPNRKVLKTSSGIVIYVDDAAKIVKLKTANNIEFTIDDASKTIELKHPVTARLFIDALGNVEVTGTTINLNPV
jgi:hypothetical protein